MSPGDLRRARLPHRAKRPKPIAAAYALMAQPRHPPTRRLPASASSPPSIRVSRPCGACHGYDHARLYPVAPVRQRLDGRASQGADRPPPSRRWSWCCPARAGPTSKRCSFFVPPDIEEALGLTDGDLFGGEIAFDQMFATPLLARVPAPRADRRPLFSPALRLPSARGATAASRMARGGRLSSPTRGAPMSDIDAVVIGGGVKRSGGRASISRRRSNVFLIVEAGSTLGGLCQPVQVFDGFLSTHVAQRALRARSQAPKGFPQHPPWADIRRRAICPLIGLSEHGEQVVISRDVHATARSIGGR